MEIFYSVDIESLSNQTILPSPVFLKLKTEGEKNLTGHLFFHKGLKKKIYWTMLKAILRDL